MSRWKPENNDIYYFVHETGTVEYVMWGHYVGDSNLYNAGNCFRTKEEAEAAAKKAKELFLSLHEETENTELFGKTEEAELPEWCKVGEWVWSNNSYHKITCIETSGYSIPLIILDDGSKYTFGSLSWDDVSQARLRPYNSEEMKSLVGKVIEHKKDLHLVTNYLNDTADNNPVVCVGTNWRDAKGLIEHNYAIDGERCCVLEHLNDNGEWVE